MEALHEENNLRQGFGQIVWCLTIEGIHEAVNENGMKRCFLEYYGVNCLTEKENELSRWTIAYATSTDGPGRFVKTSSTTCLVRIGQTLIHILNNSRLRECIK